MNQYYKSTSHIFHGIMTLIFFPWIIVWVCCHLSNKQYNEKVDRFFNHL